MPPKVKEVVLPPSEDDKLYGVFITISVDSVDIELQGQVAAAPPAPPPPPLATATGAAAAAPAAAAALAADATPRLQLSISLPAQPPDYSPPGLSTAVDAPTDLGCVTLTELAVSKAFRREPGSTTLHLLLNSPARVALLDAATGTVLAAADIDLLNLGWGQRAWEVCNVTLQPMRDTPIGLTQVKSAVISLVKVSIGQRVSALDSATVADTAAAPAATTAAAAVAPIPAELPELQPYAFISPEHVEGANIVELSFTCSQGAPSGLVAAAATAGGKLSLAAGLVLPGGTVLTVSGGVKDGLVVWAERRRQWLPAEAVRALKWHLEDGLLLVLEMARYVTAEGFSDPAWEAYHGAAELQLSHQLLVAGSTCSSAEVAVAPFSSVTVSNIRTCLPPYTPPVGKVKPIEEMPPAPADSSHVPCAWQSAGTLLHVSFGVLVPLVPPWSPPPKPTRSLEDMVPVRDLTPVVVPTTASDEFKAQVKQVAAALAEEYLRTFPAPTARAGPAAAEDLAGGAARHKVLIFELNRSGKYLQLKDSLKAAVVRLVQEKYHKPASMSPDAMGTLYNELYVDLMDQLHAVLTAESRKPRDESHKATGAAAAVPGQAELRDMLLLAQELEVAGDLPRAEAMHQRRVLADTVPQVWYEYATFCMRAANHGRAEECLKSTLALAPDHLGALSALAGLALHQGAATDALFTALAEAVCARARDTQPQAPRVWALSALVFKAQGEAKAAELASCTQELERLEREALEQQHSAMQANGFMDASHLLLELCLPEVALTALELVPSLRHSAARLTYPLLMAYAKVHSKLGNQVSMVESLQQLRRVAPSDDPEPALVAGDAHFQAGEYEAATLEYQAALAVAPEACPLSLHLRLGQCYLAAGLPEHAATVYSRGVELRPCSSTWLGVGRAQLALGDIASAELALQEANVLDGGNSSVWGHLALVGLQCGRLEQAAAALQYGLQSGLTDVALLLRIAKEYNRLGHLRQEARVLHAALGVQDSFETRVRLGAVAASQADADTARTHWQAAESLAANGQEAGQAQQLLSSLQSAPTVHA